MNEERFVDETKAKEQEFYKGDVKSWLAVYEEKVEPYLELINHWRFQEKMTVDEIRNVLGLSKSQWRVFASMPTVKEYTQKSGHYMMAKTQKDFLDAKKDNQSNAKFHEMSFKRFDTGFGDKGGTVVNLPERIEFAVSNEKMDDKEIETKAKGKE